MAKKKTDKSKKVSYHYKPDNISRIERPRISRLLYRKQSGFTQYVQSDLSRSIQRMELLFVHGFQNQPVRHMQTHRSGQALAGKIPQTDMHRYTSLYFGLPILPEGTESTPAHRDRQFRRVPKACRTLFHT